MTTTTSTVKNLSDIADEFGSAGANVVPGQGIPNMRDAFRALLSRLHGAVANATALGAVLLADRADQMIALKSDDGSLWSYSAASMVGASALVIVPTDTGAGVAGRWLLLVPGSAALAGLTPIKQTCTIAQLGDLAGLGVGVKTFAKNVGAALPANARLVGFDIGEGAFAAFDDATHGTYVIAIGKSGATTDIQTGLNVAAGQSGFPKRGTDGGHGFTLAPHGGEQIQALITSSVDLMTATAGSAVINIFYVVLP